MSQQKFYVPPDKTIGHLVDVPQANLLARYGKKLNLTQQKHAFTDQKTYTTTQKPGLVASRTPDYLRQPARDFLI